MPDRFRRPYRGTFSGRRNASTEECNTRLCTQIVCKLVLESARSGPVARSNFQLSVVGQRLISMLRRQDRHFPQEIVDIIVENVQDPADWRRCALVHRSWTPASQRQIFRQIFLELCGSCGVKILRLRDILSASPRIAANVQELALYQEQHGYFEDEEEEGENGNNDDEEENGTEMTRSQVLHGLSLVIKLIPQVQTISLCCADIHGDRWLLDPKLMQLVQSFLELPAIKNIILMEWLFPTLPSLYEFMDRVIAASLLSLTLHVDIDSDAASDSSSIAEPTPTSLSPKDGPPIILSSLDIDTNCQSFGAWIDSLSHPLVVQRLTLRGSSDVTPVLSRLSSGISELSLYDNDDHPSIDLRGLGHISKITLCVPNEHQNLSRSFVENLLTLPRSNSIKTLVVQDEIFENPGSRSAFEFIDGFISSQHLPNLIQVLLSLKSNNPTPLTARLLARIKESFPLTLEKGLLWLCHPLTGSTQQVSQIQIPKEDKWKKTPRIR